MRLAVKLIVRGARRLQGLDHLFIDELLVRRLIRCRRLGAGGPVERASWGDVILAKRGQRRGEPQQLEEIVGALLQRLCNSNKIERPG